jgi:hypothetical protein
MDSRVHPAAGPALDGAASASEAGRAEAATLMRPQLQHLPPLRQPGCLLQLLVRVLR